MIYFKPISPIPSFYWETRNFQYKRNAAIFMAIGPDILINRSIRLEWNLGSHTTMHTNRSTYTFVRAHTNMQTQNRCSHMTVDGMQRRDISWQWLVFQAANGFNVCEGERADGEKATENKKLQNSDKAAQKLSQRVLRKRKNRRDKHRKCHGSRSMRKLLLWCKSTVRTILSLIITD